MTWSKLKLEYENKMFHNKGLRWRDNTKHFQTLILNRLFHFCNNFCFIIPKKFCRCHLRTGQDICGRTICRRTSILHLVGVLPLKLCPHHLQIQRGCPNFNSPIQLAIYPYRKDRNCYSFWTMDGIFNTRLYTR